MIPFVYFLEKKYTCILASHFDVPVHGCILQIASDNGCQDLQNSCYYFYQQCHNVFDVTMNNNFQYRNQFVDTDNITRRDQREKCPNYRQ
jgi:hypothetical protein